MNEHPFTYGSVCSGIEAATVAWKPLGWHSAWFAEVEPFCNEVLAQHYPKVKNHGDFTKIGIAEPIDLLVGGTPCQSFSIAGRRAGLDDPRGNLALEFLVLARRLSPRWIVWENVLGVLSSNGGRDFGAIIGALGELGYGWAYRIFDAQHFGVPQRRRRVFVVGYLGDWRRAAAVLFEREGLSRDSAPSREARASVTAPIKQGPYSDGIGYEMNLVANPLLWVRERSGRERRQEGESTESYLDALPTRRGLRCERGRDWARDAVGLHRKDPGRRADAITAGSRLQFSVRRLTPRECERLQGFPDDYTLIRRANGKPAADGPRYRALGNSMAVPVMRWIGRRIQIVDGIEAK